MAATLILRLVVALAYASVSWALAVEPTAASAGQSTYDAAIYVYDSAVDVAQIPTSETGRVVLLVGDLAGADFRPGGPIGHVLDLSVSFVAPRALPAFSRSSIDDAVTSVSRRHNDQITVGARAIDKRLGDNSAPFQGIEATTANAQALVTDILESPTHTVFGQRTYDVYNAAGQGARFDVSSNRFITFLDETIATR